MLEIEEAKEEYHNRIVTCRANNHIGEGPKDTNIRIIYKPLEVQPSKYGFMLDIYTVETIPQFPL